MSVSIILKIGISAVIVASLTNARVFFNITARPPYTNGNSDSVKKVNPPFHGFYAKYLDCNGIAIRSTSIVDDKALYIASAKIKMMLKCHVMDR